MLGWGAFRAAKNKATGRTCPRARCCKPESGKHVNLCTSVPMGQSIGLFPGAVGRHSKRLTLLRLKWAPCAALRGLQKSATQKG